MKRQFLILTRNFQDQLCFVCFFCCLNSWVGLMGNLASQVFVIMHFSREILQGCNVVFLSSVVFCAHLRCSLLNECHKNITPMTYANKRYSFYFSWLLNTLFVILTESSSPPRNHLNLGAGLAAAATHSTSTTVFPLFSLLILTSYVLGLKFSPILSWTADGGTEKNSKLWDIWTFLDRKG